MSITSRLARLERAVPDRACPACEDRRGRPMVIDRGRPADGATDVEPLPCGVCGKLPEMVIEIVRPGREEAML
jgi:hypothetical protein